MTNWANIYRRSANNIESAASIASGHGEYGLANQLWAFEARLRQTAQDYEDAETEPEEQ